MRLHSAAAAFLLALSGCLGAGGPKQTDVDPAGPPPGPVDGAWVDSFSWSHASLEGDVGLRIGFELSKASACSGTLRASGEDDGSPIRFGFGVDAPQGTFAFRGFASERRPAELHAGAVDTRPPADGARWEYAVAYEDHFDRGTHRLLLAAFDLKDFDSRITRGETVGFSLYCGAAFRLLSFEAGREGLAFTGESFQGGAGASAVHLQTDIVADERGGSVEYGGSLHARFGCPTVLVRAFFLPAQASTGQLALRHPDGTQAWNLADAGDAPDKTHLLFEGSGGDYDLSLTRAGAGQFGISGVALGVRPISSLDELPTLSPC